MLHIHSWVCRLFGNQIYKLHVELLNALKSTEIFMFVTIVLLAVMQEGYTHLTQ